MTAFFLSLSQNGSVPKTGEVERIIWKADVEVERHLSIVDEEKTLTFSDPQTRFTKNLRNGKSSPGQEKPSFFASVIFHSSQSVLSADGKRLKAEATIFLKEFLATLSLVSKSKREIMR
jgi:hypothetical protein